MDKYLLVKCLLAKYQFHKCWLAKCYMTKYLLAKCLFAKCQLAKCWLTKCLPAECVKNVTWPNVCRPNVTCKATMTYRNKLECLPLPFTSTLSLIFQCIARHKRTKKGHSTFRRCLLTKSRSDRLFSTQRRGTIFSHLFPTPSKLFFLSFLQHK